MQRGALTSPSFGVVRLASAAAVVVLTASHSAQRVEWWPRPQPAAASSAPYATTALGHCRQPIEKHVAD